jgi:hypothetical protein
VTLVFGLSVLWTNYHYFLNYGLIVVFWLPLEFWVYGWNVLEVTKGFFFSILPMGSIKGKVFFILLVGITMV